MKTRIHITLLICLLLSGCSNENKLDDLSILEFRLSDQVLAKTQIIKRRMVDLKNAAKERGNPVLETQILKFCQTMRSDCEAFVNEADSLRAIINKGGEISEQTLLNLVEKGSLVQNQLYNKRHIPIGGQSIDDFKKVAHLIRDPEVFIAQMEIELLDYEARIFANQESSFSLNWPYDKVELASVSLGENKYEVYLRPYSSLDYPGPKSIKWRYIDEDKENMLNPKNFKNGKGLVETKRKTPTIVTVEHTDVFTGMSIFLSDTISH